MSLEDDFRFNCCFLRFGKYFYESSLPAHHLVDLCNYDDAAESANHFEVILKASKTSCNCSRVEQSHTQTSKHEYLD